MIKCPILILMLAAVLFSARVFSQGGITTHTTNNQTFLEFKNQNGQLIKSLDINALTPYTDKFKPAYSGNRKLTFFTESYASTPGKNFGVICHKVIVFEQELHADKGSYQRQELGESTLVLYDSTGAEVWRKIVAFDNAIWPYVTVDGRYVAVGFTGGVYGQHARKSGFMVYDVKANLINLDFQCSPAYIWQLGDLFIINEWNTERHTYYVFDTQQSVLREKTFTRNEANMIKRLDPKGLIFLVLPDRERLDPFAGFEKVKP